MKINQILGKIYKTNQEKSQNISVFELKIWRKIIKFIDILVLLFVFYATLRYRCEMKNDRQRLKAIKI